MLSEPTYLEMESHKCFCGEPLHYSDLNVYARIQKQVEEFGEMLEIASETSGRIYLVPRHYMALHGVKADTLHLLGFEYKGQEKDNKNARKYTYNQ